MSKELHDIDKLYSSMIRIIREFPPNIPKTMYCARFYDNEIFFEELFSFQDSCYRKIYVLFQCPTTAPFLTVYLLYV
ncbi:hypothetical protein BDF21DRAFT_408106 [Thamnidium elegans]|nr:hypothetical protein BDF21DRAFT_408106 [Thamnidium elegans]